MTVIDGRGAARDALALLYLKKKLEHSPFGVGPWAARGAAGDFRPPLGVGFRTLAALIRTVPQVMYSPRNCTSCENH